MMNRNLHKHEWKRCILKVIFLVGSHGGSSSISHKIKISMSDQEN